MVVLDRRYSKGNVHNFVSCGQDRTVILCLLVDVASWREGGGRGAMQQQQNKPDSPSSPTGSTSQGLTETQQNGPPTSSPVEVPSQPPRPGSGPTPGGPMPMGPPMGMPPQYRMMPPYVSSGVFNMSKHCMHLQ